MNNGKQVKPIVLIVIAALICVGVLFIALSIMGFVFQTNPQGNMFIGRANKGQPVSGTVRYPTGDTATLDYANRTITFSNGDVYTGDIVGINRHGKGMMVYKSSGDTYVGDFYEDKIAGNGTFTYRDGDIYTGSFADNKYHGSGKVTFADGSTYEGHFENGVKNGFGVYTWAAALDGSFSWYEGYFADDVKSGQGAMHYANGDNYTGYFVNDQRNGSGTYIWANGERYEGNFINNLMDTRRQDENGEFMIGPDGSFVHGSEGVYTFSSGKNYTGYFEAGKVIGIEVEVKEPD